ncbi:MAG: MFS transporter [Coriobacteriia bacterium]|nr:MFS transporter [Coriobacteriia bacterium]MBN2847354.1 MFS transporter [Coriobacteriia bacterium]
MAASTPAAVDQARASTGPYRAVLRNKRFRALWLSQFVSGLGDWLVVGLLIPLVTTLSGGSSFAVAGIMIAKIIPSLLFSSVVGSLVDRFDRRRLMIACDLVRALLTLPLLVTNNLALIYLVVLLMEIASLFFSPARNALIPRIVAEDEVAVANGLAYTTQQASMLIGLTMSGGILAGFEAIVRWVLESGFPFIDVFVGPFAPALLGPRAGVVLNSLTFLISALLLWSIRVRVRPQRDGGGFHLSLIGKDVVESFRFLRDQRQLRGLLITISMALLGGGSIITVGLAYVQEILAHGVPILDQFEAIRTLVAAPQTFVLVLLALGMVAGAILAPRLAERIPLQMLFLGAVTTFGVSMLVFASVGVYWVSLLFGITAGFCIACLTVAGNTYVARTVTDDIRGRVFTAMESVVRVSLLMSMVVVAPLADVLAGIIRTLSAGMTDPSWFTGSRVTLQIASLIVLGAAYYAYRTLDWRREAPEGAGTGQTAEEDTRE